ncbi:hypothetical protein FRZ03_20835 [Streptomyces misionensis]|uniref:Uncharacterized protein n=1 Tax=Streptomyces misionensis TaxID=67331 RepID=A0A5C6JMS9_9ACTN|nr:hypothetical protein FRZ03_20835 [Streptomyces misionensis]
MAFVALGPAAQAAHAADGGTLTAVPGAPAPGTDVTLRVSGCTGRQATAASRAFVSDARLTGAGGTLSGETRVGSSVGPGAYGVKVTCADRVVDGTITVVADGAAKGVDASTRGRPGGALATPVAPVDAGGGATARFATVATSGSGPETAQALTGLALASVAAVAVGLRARRGRRPR